MRPFNKIMLIDDDPADNDYHKIIIEDAKVAESVEVFRDPEEALAKLKSGQTSVPELILLDINMPGMNGFQFMDEYAKLGDQHQGTAIVVMLTVSRNPDDELRGRKSPYLSGFIHKPLTGEVLRDLLKEHFS